MHSVSVDSQIGCLTALTCLLSITLNPHCNPRIVDVLHKPLIVHNVKQFQRFPKFERVIHLLFRGILTHPPQNDGYVSRHRKTLRRKEKPCLALLLYHPHPWCCPYESTLGAIWESLNIRWVICQIYTCIFWEVQYASKAEDGWFLLNTLK